MKNLIVLENSFPTFNPELKIIKEFRSLIEKDKGSPGDSDGRKKLYASKQLAFIFYYCDYRSPYIGYDVQPRKTKIEDLLNIKVSISELQDCIDVYESMQDGLQFKLLKSAYNTINRSIDFFNSVDYTIRDERGNFLYDINSVNKAIDQCRLHINNLKQLEKDVKEDLSLGKRIKGGGQIGSREA